MSRLEEIITTVPQVTVEGTNLIKLEIPKGGSLWFHEFRKIYKGKFGTHTPNETVFYVLVPEDAMISETLDGIRDAVESVNCWMREQASMIYKAQEYADEIFGRNVDEAA